MKTSKTNTKFDEIYTFIDLATFLFTGYALGKKKKHQKTGSE